MADPRLIPVTYRLELKLDANQREVLTTFLKRQARKAIPTAVDLRLNGAIQGAIVQETKIEIIFSILQELDDHAAVAELQQAWDDCALMAARP